MTHVQTAPSDTSLSTLQAELIQQILTMVQSGRWREGDKISDSALAKELNVSRTPVRQAFTYLVNAGLLAQRTQRGFFLARDLVPGETIESLLPGEASDTLYERLMSARATGQIADEVSETELVSQFDAPRGAIRRVLLKFSNQGLVERLPGHGWRFFEDLANDDAVAESYSFRLVVECGALTHPNYAPDPDQLTRLQQAQKNIHSRPIDQLTRDEWFNANAEFHETIVSWARNRFFTLAVRRQNHLRRMTEYADFGKLSEQRLHEACRDHLAILDAIAEGDYDFASALLRRHISRSAAMDI